ncbi:endo-1,4-beta-xylanase [Parvularcula sp. LCG005]|uniref:endo-1,4-beta-xylanase n=1 Tax=Parvularcula sp. LCG005 TaxID=3078805 RepID=UPI0029432398|nr:endo-1,4-beta-xylanase [Parvularcula sp. LCG005]WOI53480.1 endo-1,4-beta-xylanase [Parvularcula sp. LCG005]
MAQFSRRGFVTLLGSTALVACTGKSGAEASAEGAVSGQPSLASLAKAKNIKFGSAMAAGQLNNDRYTDIIKRECGIIVAENENKIYVINPQPDVMNFAPGDALVDFAKANDLGMRGHTLIWHHPQWLPKWINEKDWGSAANAEAYLNQYVSAVASRYEPFYSSWDVVNETIDPATGELRETSFSRAMGPEVIDYCFHVAREAAPSAKLAYNDYMDWAPASDKHRAGVLRLVERLVKSGAPIDAVGLQSHSNEDAPAGYTKERARIWKSFCDEIVGMGLDLYITEFDVDDSRMEADITARDTEIAAYTKDYLDLMLSYPQTKDLLIWGMVDSENWLQGFQPREDGLPKRPTVYDADYQPKPMRDAIAAALKAAPQRDAG